MPGASLMMGMGGGTLVAMPNLNVTDSQSAPSTANAFLSLNSNGSYSAAGVGTGSWLIASTNGAAYDVRATLNSGTSPAGSAVGSWLAMSSNRGWSLGQIGLGSDSGELLLEFRPTGGGPNLDTATISFSAEVS